MTRRSKAEFVLELPSDLRVIEAAVNYLVGRCRAYAFGGSRLEFNLRVSLTEALANAILYGNRSDPGKTIRVEVSLSNHRIVVSVEDEGHGFDPESVPDPTLPENLQRTGGRGVFLIRQLMDEVQYSDRGNSVRLILRRQSTKQIRRSGGDG